MRIVCISDTHNRGSKGHHSILDGDTLVHTGDLTVGGTPAEVREEFLWLESLPHKNKIFVAGNHDFFFQDYPELVPRLLAGHPTITYLQDSEVIIDGIKFYGSPWQPYFYDWAFNFPQKDRVVSNIAYSKWLQIPQNTQVLLTHGPPMGILDKTTRDERTGCPALRKRVFELPKLRLHAFGHIHDSWGVRVHGQTTFVNAAICDKHYEPTQAPIVVDL